MKYPVAMCMPLFYLSLLLIYLVLPCSIQSHGFCEHATIKHSYVKDDVIFAVCKKAVRRKKIYIPSCDTHTYTHTHVQQKMVLKGGQSSVPWYVRFSCSDAHEHVISCSPLQEFYCVDTNTWIPAYQLCVGDRLLSYHGPCVITDVEHVKKELKVYALEVESPHTFFVGHDALLTHNMELPTMWLDLAPAVIFGSGTALSIGSSAAVGAALAPVLIPVVLIAGLAATGVITALVDACCSIVPMYHAAVNGIQSLFNANQKVSRKQNIKETNRSQNTGDSGGGPKKNDDKKSGSSPATTALTATVIKKAEEKARELAEKAQKSQNIVRVSKDVAPRRETISSERVCDVLNNPELKQLEQQCIKIQRNDGKRPGTWEDIPGMNVQKYEKLEIKTLNKYENFRQSNYDIEKISDNTGISSDIIKKIKDHIFNNKHIRLNHRTNQEIIEKFDPNIDMIEAWERLQYGNYMDSDLELMKHEFAESILMGNCQIEYSEAHQIIDLFFNWFKSLKG